MANTKSPCPDRHVCAELHTTQPIQNQGWQKNVIEQENVGYVLPEMVTEQAATEFAAYTQNITLHKLQRINALQVAKEKYSLDIAVGKYVKIFNCII